MRTTNPAYVTRRKKRDGSRDEEWTFSMVHRGQKYLRKVPEHLRTKAEAQAWGRMMAKQLRCEESRARAEEFLDVVKRKRTCASGAEVIEAYLASAKGTAFEKTARKNANDLRTIWREGAGTEDFAGMAFDKLCSRQTMERFIAGRQGRERGDYDTRRPENRTINSMMNHARCVLARGSVERRLRGLSLGDWEPFVKVPYLPTPARYWTRIDVAVLAAMDAAAGSLDEEMRLAYDLARLLGLRVAEITHARGSWLMPYACESGWGIQICDRPEEGWTQKGTRPRVLPLPVALSRTLLARRDADAFVLPGRTKTARKLLMDKLSAWLRPYLPGRAKTTHELRKQYGSEVLTRQGLTAASYALGHMQQSTTERDYAAYLGDLRVA